jgi:hypothetical protein
MRMSVQASPGKWLYLAQLLEGNDAVAAFGKGIALLTAQASSPALEVGGQVGWMRA